MTAFFAELTRQDGSDGETAEPPGAAARLREERPLTMAEAVEAWLPEMLQIVGPEISADERAGLAAEICESLLSNETGCQVENSRAGESEPAERAQTSATLEVGRCLQCGASLDEQVTLCGICAAAGSLQLS